MKTQAFNPILPSYEYIPDAEPYVFDDRLYIFGSHDRFNGEDFCMNDYVCWSAPIDDLGAWRKEGVIYRASQDPLNQDGTQHLFAPDVLRGKDGKYYLFYCLHRSPTVSVAVCDTPSGEYQFYGHLHYADGTLYGQKQGDVFNFDPGIFMDEDGKIFLYTGLSHRKEAPIRKMLENVYQIGGSYCVELKEDMLTLKTEPKMVIPGEVCAEGTDFEGHGFFEASSMRKINGLYYLVYSSVKSHDLCYAISKSPTDEFRYGGVIVSIGDIGLVEEEKATNYLSNTHGGLVEVKGQWYIFYHRHTNLHRNSRQMCAEPVTIAMDGSIAQVEVTSCGLNGGPLSDIGKYEARIACNLSSANGTFLYQNKRAAVGTHPYFTQEGEDREDHPDQYIANMQDGSWAGFKYFTFHTDELAMDVTKRQEKEYLLRRLTVCIRGDANGILEIRKQRGCEPIAKIIVNPMKQWHQESVAFLIEPGIHPLYFTFRGMGTMDFFWFSLQKGEKQEERIKE